ncbi:MAG: cytochrome c3 family protein [Rubripirellula sp.]
MLVTANLQIRLVGRVATVPKETKLKRILICVSAVVMLVITIGLNQRPQQSHAALPPQGNETSADVDADAGSSSKVALVPEGQPTYVGRDVCRECHQENYDLHGQHGHAHTFAMASEPEVMSKFVGREFDYGDPYGRFIYEQDDDGLVARLADEESDPFRLEYALGSGHNAFTLLSLEPDDEKGTVACEHRASWFRSGDRLGRTPGQPLLEPESELEKFGMKHSDNVMQKCIYCHVTTGVVKDQQIVGLTANVNCEKCHGPASEHVRQARAMKNPPPFSVGESNWDSESEIHLCGDCHRLPEAISQKELRDYPRTLARFQPVGLLRSECFIQSNGKLRCTTCHNPHKTNREETEAEHVSNCIQCHQVETESHVSCPVSKTEGCIDCHMPKYEFESLGTGFHDHWIRVHPED